MIPILTISDTVSVSCESKGVISTTPALIAATLANARTLAASCSRKFKPVNRRTKRIARKIEIKPDTTRATTTPFRPATSMPITMIGIRMKSICRLRMKSSRVCPCAIPKGSESEPSVCSAYTEASTCTTKITGSHLSPIVSRISGSAMSAAPNPAGSAMAVTSDCAR